MTLTYKDVATIITLVRESPHCRTLQIDADGMRIALERHEPARASTAAAPSTPASTAIKPTNPAPTNPAPTAVPKPAQPDVVARPSTDQGYVVTAPLLGIFYRALKPDAPPCVEVGTEVRIGDTLGLIEVMKLFTSVESPISGRVTEIYALNAELVEFGQPLFRIDTGS